MQIIVADGCYNFEYVEENFLLHLKVQAKKNII